MLIPRSTQPGFTPFFERLPDATPAQIGKANRGLPKRKTIKAAKRLPEGPYEIVWYRLKRDVDGKPRRIPLKSFGYGYKHDFSHPRLEHVQSAALTLLQSAWARSLGARGSREEEARAKEFPILPDVVTEGGDVFFTPKAFRLMTQGLPQADASSIVETTAETRAHGVLADPNRGRLYIRVFRNNTSENPPYDSLVAKITGFRRPKKRS